MKNTYIQVRVSEEQKKRLRKKAEKAGLNLSQYVLAKALGKI